MNLYGNVEDRVKQVFEISFSLIPVESTRIKVEKFKHKTLHRVHDSHVTMKAKSIT